MINCPDCGSELTFETNRDMCPNSLRKDGLHPIFVVALDNLNAIADAVLSHHPNPKTKAAKRRIRRNKRKAKGAAK